jgi:hypothetical protein
LLACASPFEDETSELAHPKASVARLADAEAARRVKGRRVVARRMVCAWDRMWVRRVAGGGVCRGCRM